MSAGAAIVVLVLILWGALAIVEAMSRGTKSFFETWSKDIKANRERREKEKKQAAIEKERRQIENFRKSYPVQVIGAPNPDLLKKISDQLDQFIKTVKSHRPQIQPYSERFRLVTFSYPFDVFFPRENATNNGPDPEKWQTTLDDLTIKAGRPLRPIYDGLASACEFPVKQPVVVFVHNPLPQLPKMQLPSWSIKIIEKETGREINIRSDIEAKAYAAEVEQADILRQKANAWQKQIKQKWEEAKGEQEIADLFVTNMDLKFKELQQSVDAEYQDCKKRFEREAAAALEPIRKVYKAYLLGTKEGIEEHFSLALETLALPVPPRFPWRVFYDPDEEPNPMTKATKKLSHLAIEDRATTNQSLSNYPMTGAEMTLARYYAKQAVLRELRDQGIKLQHVEACEITRAANQYIDDHPGIITFATERYRSLVASGRLRPPRRCKGFRCANVMIEMEGRMIIGYARVSTDGQTLDAQHTTLRAAGAEKVFAEKVSGAKTNRAQLAKAIEALGAGDVLLVTRLDRLARSTRDLLNVLATIADKGAGFKSLADAWADTTTAHGRLMLTVLGGLAEFERELISARTDEGRKRAQARGVRFGRKLKLTQHQITEALRRREAGEALVEIGRSYNVSHSTISRLTEPHQVSDAFPNVP
jgi:DNA invertase Pin-like site-specific DNA recombinase